VKDYRSVKLVNSDFQTTRNLKFPRRGSKYTPPHTQRTFTFRDYAPLVFARIRQKFGLDPADYLDALTREAKMTCIRSPGKSASMFFYSYDGRFMVKTINKEECTKLMDILPAYYDVRANPLRSAPKLTGSAHQLEP
jgi:1-phosphatidylinositol-4-phosphate 5-kinase